MFKTVSNVLATVGNNPRMMYRILEHIGFVAPALLVGTADSIAFGKDTPVAATFQINDMIVSLSVEDDNIMREMCAEGNVMDALRYLRVRVDNLSGCRPTLDTCSVWVSKRYGKLLAAHSGK